MNMNRTIPRTSGLLPLAFVAALAVAPVLRAQSPDPTPPGTNWVGTHPAASPSVSPVPSSNEAHVEHAINAVETDSRVPSNGKVWRVDQAVITDTNRPRVLLVGDSILNGYFPMVVGKLKGKAYVDGWINPFCQSERYNKELAAVLDKGPYDVVHINTGLHGFQKGRIPDGQFEPLTRSFVELIRTKCPKATIIWASTTPVSVKGDNSQLDPEINPLVVEQNRMAAKVMGEMNAQVDDFYTLVLNHPEMKHDPFHWQREGYSLMATSCAESVTKALPSKGAGH